MIHVIPRYRCKNCGVVFSVKEYKHLNPLTEIGQEHLDNYGSIPIKSQQSGVEDIHKWALWEYSQLLHICTFEQYGIADLVGYDVIGGDGNEG